MIWQMGKVIGKPQVLKEVNSSMIEQLIYERGPLSKPELARITSLSMPTVSKLVDNLEKSKRLCQAGRTGKGAGRKAILYETNRNSGCILAVFFHTRGLYRCRIVDMLSNTLSEDFFPLDAGSSRSAAASTQKAIDSMIERAPTKVKAIGVALPCVVKPDGALMSIPQIEPWEGFNLAEMLAARYKTSIFVENITNLLAVGYYHTILKERQNNIVYIYVGNGIGSGLILNKQLYKGSIHSSGEIGFMVFPENRLPSGEYTVSRGYLETELSRVVDYDHGGFREKNDPKQKELLVTVLGMVAVNYVATLNPEVIVFGGWVFNKTLIEEIGRKIACYIPGELMPRIMHDDSDSTGIDGLIMTCRSFITPEIHLVQNSGQIRSRAV
jgi:predicted NBD/HSP70 family sugar kinase